MANSGPPVQLARNVYALLDSSKASKAHSKKKEEKSDKGKKKEGKASLVIDEAVWARTQVSVASWADADDADDADGGFYESATMMPSGSPLVVQSHT